MKNHFVLKEGLQTKPFLMPVLLDSEKLITQSINKGEIENYRVFPIIEIGKTWLTWCEQKDSLFPDSEHTIAINQGYAKTWRPTNMRPIDGQALLAYYSYTSRGEIACHGSKIRLATREEIEEVN